MRDRVGMLTEGWSRLGHDLGFGVGIAQGFATLGRKVGELEVLRMVGEAVNSSLDVDRVFQGHGHRHPARGSRTDL